MEDLCKREMHATLNYSFGLLPHISVISLQGTVDSEVQKLKSIHHIILTTKTCRKVTRTEQKSALNYASCSPAYMGQKIKDDPAEINRVFEEEIKDTARNGSFF